MSSLPEKKTITIEMIVTPNDPTCWDPECPYCRRRCEDCRERFDQCVCDLPGEFDYQDAMEKKNP